MNYKKINNKNHQLGSFLLNTNLPNYNSKFGLIYTIFSDQSNLIEVGFAENNRILEKRLSESEAILLDKKIGQKQDLNLLIDTLIELGIKFNGQYKFNYSKTLIRHLSTLGWPIGKSLYKRKLIRKELSCA